MKRRNFIFITSLGAIAIAIPSYLKYNSAQKDKLKIPFQLTNILSIESILKIGNEYLSLFSDENNKEKLVELLLAGNSDNLELRIQEDYKNDKIVIIDGWVLAKTEGRQCALFSLLQTKLNLN